MNLSFAQYFLLSEANIFNREDLINGLTTIIKNKTNSPEILKWFMTQYIKWLQTDDGSNVMHHLPHRYKSGEPEWAQKEGISDFQGFHTGEKDKINHIIDYFNALPPLDLQKIYKEPYPVISDKVQQWNQQMLKKAQTAKISANTDTDLKTLMLFPDGFRIVELLSKKAFKEEGDSMGHCVGTYEPGPKSKILSLRDPQNHPHITMEAGSQYDEDLKTTDIIQIKGKGNKAPHQKYWRYIQEFILKNPPFEVMWDGDNVGFFRVTETERAHRWKFVNPLSTEGKKLKQEMDEAVSKAAASKDLITGFKLLETLLERVEGLKDIAFVDYFNKVKEKWPIKTISELVTIGRKVPSNIKEAMYEGFFSQLPVRTLKIGRSTPINNKPTYEVDYASGMKMLSTPTRNNVEAVAKNTGTTWKKILVTLVPERGVFSYFVLGKNKVGGNVYYIRKETGHPMSGQSWVMTDHGKYRVPLITGLNQFEPIVSEYIKEIATAR